MKSPYTWKCLHLQPISAALWIVPGSQANGSYFGQEVRNLEANHSLASCADETRDKVEAGGVDAFLFEQNVFSAAWQAVRADDGSMFPFSGC